MTKIVFLDRDGTIIIDKHYSSNSDEIEFLPGSIEAMKLLQDNGFDLVIVTNQSGIGRGIFSLEQYASFNDRFMALLQSGGIEIREVLMCPHIPDDQCNCRKPRTKLIEDYLKKNNLRINKSKSYVIGDKQSDLELGDNLGIKSFLITAECCMLQIANNIAKKS